MITKRITIESCQDLLRKSSNEAVSLKRDLIMLQEDIDRLISEGSNTAITLENTLSMIAKLPKLFPKSNVINPKTRFVLITPR